jgi:hypothetical protein
MMVIRSLFKHPPVLLDETRSQNFVPRDDLIKRMLEYMLVDHSLDPQHSQQVEPFANQNARCWAEAARGSFGIKRSSKG